VVDLYRLWIFARKKGSLSKPLICKASGASNTSYQQSYPQKLGICRDTFANQGLAAPWHRPFTVGRNKP
jgi:hypothetical protein